MSNFDAEDIVEELNQELNQEQQQKRAAAKKQKKTTREKLAARRDELEKELDDIRIAIDFLDSNPTVHKILNS